MTGSAPSDRAALLRALAMELDARRAGVGQCCPAHRLLRFTLADIAGEYRLRADEIERASRHG